MGYLDPRQDKKPSIDDNAAKILDPLLFRPSQITISTPNVTRSGTPPQTGYDSTTGEGEILQMLPHRPRIPQIMVLLDEAVIKLL
jgi:hypothetical protein